MILLYIELHFKTTPGIKQLMEAFILYVHIIFWGEMVQYMDNMLLFGSQSNGLKKRSEKRFH